ncbi:hypothetical protein BKG85_04780 [Mycobacteroides chelonae]|nr:hypothetical protein BKG85_04780 [Mycobacteroides chelonae]
MQWETGECQPRPRTISAIAAAVGITAGDLYQISGDAPLAERRKAAGLNQIDIANALGVNRATVSQWERGARPVPARHRSSYNVLLGIDNDDTVQLHADDTDPPVSHDSKDVVEPQLSSPANTSDVNTVGHKKSVLGGAALVAHLMVAHDMEFSGGELLRKDPQQWYVYSPQHIQVDKTRSTDLEQLMEDIALPLVRLGYRKLCSHIEERIIIDDEPIRVVRVQSNPPSETRQELSRIFVSSFTPQYYRKGVGEDLDKKAQLRKDLASFFPESVAGEMLFVIALSTDTYGWLEDQTLPYAPYSIVSYLPEENRYFLASVHYDHMSAGTNSRPVSVDDLGVTRETTISQIAQRLTSHPH